MFVFKNELDGLGWGGGELTILLIPPGEGTRGGGRQEVRKGRE